MVGGNVPALVVLDLDTPGLDLSPLLARFKADQRWAHMRIVVTGSAIPSDLPVDDVLPKPFDAESLVNFARER